MLANPTISVIDDQDASIFIGDTLRFQSLAVSSPTSGSQFTVVEVPVGIILLCHPRVNGDNEITLRLHPVVSTVTALVNGLPQTSAREAETVVRVKDGDTLVLGGLIRDEDIREMSKVPLLGDLPIIGHLFRHNSKQHRRTEVMVVITVRLQK
jgi:type II secretory pathway component GspD/PulD (secretin)